MIDDECRQGLERLKGFLSHFDPRMTLGQIMGRLVREGLDSHDPARPPRGRRTAPAKGAEQTSAAKTGLTYTSGQVPIVHLVADLHTVVEWGRRTWPRTSRT